VLIEPISEERQVRGKVLPAVPRPFADDQLGRHTHFLELRHDEFGLLDRHQLVGVAVNDQRRRIVRRDVIHRRDRPADFPNLLLVGHRHERLRLRVEGLERKGRLEAGKGAAAERFFALLAVVEEVGRREEAGDGLHPAGETVDRIGGLGVAHLAGGPLHQRQVAAGGPAVDAEPIGIDLVVLRMVADEANRPVHVFEDFGDRVFRLTAVDDREDGVAALDELLDGAGADVCVRGEPTAADDRDQAGTVAGLLWREDVESQGGAEFAPIDDILCARVSRAVLGGGRAGAASDAQEHGGETFHGRLLDLSG